MDENSNDDILKLTQDSLMLANQIARDIQGKVDETILIKEIDKSVKPVNTKQKIDEIKSLFCFCVQPDDCNDD